MLARAIHAWSPVATGPLETLHCAAVPEPLQARELFGCAAGTYPALPDAFEGAIARAAGGTLLLEGIEALAAPVRTALSRALAVNRYRPGGRQRPSVRCAPASSRRRSAGAGETPFGVAHQEIVIAPLAERREDVLPLAAHFLALFAAEAGSRAGRLRDRRPHRAARGALARQRRRAARARAPGRAPRGRRRGLRGGPDARGPRGSRAVVPRREARLRSRVTSQGLLRLCDGNISQAARLAKKDRKDFYDVIRRTGVDPSLFRR